jgi:AcrR family transcriptional regulator
MPKPLPATGGHPPASNRNGASRVSPPPEVKERIRSAALTLFGRKGYAAAGVRDICRAAETTAPMVYYYYGSKHGLYQAILAESIQAQRVQMDRAVRQEGDPLRRLETILKAWLGVGEEPVVRQLRLFFIRELLGLGSDFYRRTVENSDRALRHALKAVLQDGIDQGVFRPAKVEMAVLAITGIVNTFSRRAALGVPVSLEDGIEQVMDTFVQGLAARQPSARASASSTSAAPPIAGPVPAGR